MEDQDPLVQLHNILEDQDTFLVKLPHSLKEKLAGGEDFDEIVGAIQSIRGNQEKNKLTSESLEFELQLQMLQSFQKDYFDLTLPSMKEIVQTKRAHKNGKS